jgi:hypothetical protein
VASAALPSLVPGTNLHVLTTETVALSNVFDPLELNNSAEVNLLLKLTTTKITILLKVIYS